jgi:hypothetical protein
LQVLIQLARAGPAGGFSGGIERMKDEQQSGKEERREGIRRLVWRYGFCGLGIERTAARVGVWKEESIKRKSSRLSKSWRQRAVTNSDRSPFSGPNSHAISQRIHRQFDSIDSEDTLIFCFVQFINMYMTDGFNGRTSEGITLASRWQCPKVVATQTVQLSQLYSREALSQTSHIHSFMNISMRYHFVSGHCREARISRDLIYHLPQQVRQAIGREK